MRRGPSGRSLSQRIAARVPPVRRRDAGRTRQPNRVLRCPAYSPLARPGAWWPVPTRCRAPSTELTSSSRAWPACLAASASLARDGSMHVCRARRRRARRSRRHRHREARQPSWRQRGGAMPRSVCQGAHGLALAWWTPSSSRGLNADATTRPGGLDADLLTAVSIGTDRVGFMKKGPDSGVRSANAILFRVVRDGRHALCLSKEVGLVESIVRCLCACAVLRSGRRGNSG